MFSNKLKNFFGFLKYFKLTKQGMKAIYIDYLFIRPFIWLVFIDEFIFDFYLLEGESMLPTFDNYGNIVIVDKISTSKLFPKIINYITNNKSPTTINFKRGEVVCLFNPSSTENKICKRVVHLEGDEVTLRNGNKLTIPKNHIWVEGDNKSNSYDSRSFGPVSKALVIGKVPIQIWPRLILL